MRDIAVKWMVAYIKAVSFYNDPANKIEVIRLLAEFTGTPEIVFRTYYRERSQIYFAPDGKSNAENLKAQQEFWTKQGQLKGPPVSVEQWLDQSFIEEANERLA